MKCGDCINYGTCRHTCNVVRISDICSSFLGKLSCDGCKYDSDRFSDICYHDCIMFSNYQKEDISIPKETKMKQQFTEEELKDFLRVINGGTFSHLQIKNARESGYIRKSDLEILIEECDTMYKSYHDNKRNFSQEFFEYIGEVLVKQNNCIQAMKAELNKRRGG